MTLYIECLCVHARAGARVWVCACVHFFPQAVSRAAESLVTYSACVVFFKLLFNFYFLFYSWPNPNATQLCSQPEKEGLGEGLPGPGERSHALQLLPTDGREMGLPAWAYLLFVGQTDPPFGHNTMLKSLHLVSSFFPFTVQLFEAWNG